jgi:hypothetical protein
MVPRLPLATAFYADRTISATEISEPGQLPLPLVARIAREAPCLAIIKPGVIRVAIHWRSLCPLVGQAQGAFLAQYARVRARAKALLGVLRGLNKWRVVAGGRGEGRAQGEEGSPTLAIQTWAGTWIGPTPRTYPIDL